MVLAYYIFYSVCFTADSNAVVFILLERMLREKWTSLNHRWWLAAGAGINPLFHGAPATCLWSSSVHGIGGTLCYCGTALVYASEGGLIHGKTDSKAENHTRPEADSSIVANLTCGFLKPEWDFSDHLVRSPTYKRKI